MAQQQTVFLHPAPPMGLSHLLSVAWPRQAGLVAKFDEKSGLTGSLAIDSGNPAAPGTVAAACEKTDQRGIARPQSGRCDIAAYERRPGTPHGPEVGDEESEIEAQP